jgi:N-acetylglutamate synthase-like GNAT family acetyltransferase
MEPVSTRRARPEDKEALEEIAVAAYSPYLERMGGLRPAPLDADYGASIANDVVWVAEVEGRVAGFAVIVDETDATLLENVAVHPDSQGSGVGRQLMAIAEDHARAAGNVGVRLYTHSTMRENTALLLALGVRRDRAADGGRV